MWQDVGCRLRGVFPPARKARLPFVYDWRRAGFCIVRGRDCGAPSKDQEDENSGIEGRYEMLHLGINIPHTPSFVVDESTRRMHKPTEPALQNGLAREPLSRNDASLCYKNRFPPAVTSIQVESYLREGTNRSTSRISLPPSFPPSLPPIPSMASRRASYSSRSKNILHMRQAQHARTPRSASVSRAGGGRAGGGHTASESLGRSGGMSRLHNLKGSTPFYSGSGPFGGRRPGRSPEARGWGGERGSGSGRVGGSATKKAAVALRTLLGGVSSRITS